MSDTATQWLQGLAARGISVAINRGRVRISPAAGYKSLSDAELLFLRHHRKEILAVIATGATFDVRKRSAPAPPTPEPCRFCGQTPCIGPAHSAFETLHSLDPAEVERRRKEATAEMFATLGRPHRAWDGL